MRVLPGSAATGGIYFRRYHRGLLTWIPSRAQPASLVVANRMREEDIDFQQCSHAFMRCAKPERLQELADELSPRDLVVCGQKWLACFTPFFTAAEREHAGCHHRLFFAQTEFCDNLVFHRRAALDRLGERPPDANRTIGQPTIRRSTC